MPPLTLTQPSNQLDLTDFYRRLSKQQIRDLKALLEKTEFRYDIVANLPTELVPLVFHHLGLSQSYRCRHVSRRWHELLSSEQVVKALLHPWNATEDLPLRISGGSPPHSVLDIQAEHQDAFRTGKPSSSIRIPHGQDPSPDMDSLIHAYSDGFLSWVERSEGCDRICLYELETSTLCHFIPPERESIDEIILSGKLLAAMTTSARCYIWAHRTSSLPYSLRLPSRCPITFHLSDSSFVLLQTPPDLTTKPFTYEHGEIVVWKMQESAVDKRGEVTLRAGVSMIPIRLPCGTSIQCWYDITLDKGQQNIVLTESMFNTNERTHTFKILHFNISGTQVFEGSLERPYATDITWSVHESNFKYKQRFFEIWMFTNVDHDGPELSLHSSQKTTITHLRYSMDRRVIQLIEQKNVSHRHHLPAWKMKGLYLWKWIGYSEEPRLNADKEVSYQVKVLDFRNDMCVEAQVGAYRRDDSTISFLGDEIFLIRITSTYFEVLCFDKHREMAGQTILSGRKASLCGDKAKE